LVSYNGASEMAREYSKPFHNIGPLSIQTGEGSVHDLAVVTFMGADPAGCAHGMSSFRYPIGLKSYDVAAVRQVYNEIGETFNKVPGVSGSFFLLEGYSTQAVKAVDPKTTAFPHRDDNILATSYIM
jgi:hypothetical protein